MNELQVINQVSKNFKCVYSPNEVLRGTKRNRFFVSINQLHKYVGVENTYKASIRVLGCKADKCTVKLRKYGKLDFYSK